MANRPEFLLTLVLRYCKPRSKYNLVQIASDHQCLTLFLYYEIPSHCGMTSQNVETVPEISQKKLLSPNFV